MKPFTLSDLMEETTSVEPGSTGASRAMHSSRPLFKDASFSCKELSSHSSSRAYHCYQFLWFNIRAKILAYQGGLFRFDQFISR